MLEREIKLGAAPGFELPDLGARRLAEQELDAVYFDTPDLRLVRSGVSVRHRTGDDPPWTVKLADSGERDDALVRMELSFPGELDRVPDEVAALVRAYRRTAELGPVARLRTVRRRLEVADDGEPVAEIDDDEVTVVDGDKVLARFREVEVELAPGADPAQLDEIVTRLRDAGAGAPDKTSKVVRALGPRALAPPDVVAPSLGDDCTAGDVVRAGIARAVVRIIDHDPVVRLDAGPEGVHQMRVGARRLRSDLRTFEPLIAGDWAEPLRAELKWLAGVLGEVRDRDVLVMRLSADGAALGEADGPAVETILARLRQERDDALEAALAALGSDRYGRLLDSLVEAANEPKLSEAADAPALEVVPALVGRAWGRLAKAVDKLGKHPDDEALHRVRILAKRGRYSADVAVPVVGKPAKKLSSELGRLQDALGSQQDAAVADAWLRGLSADLTPAEAFAAGKLAGLQRADSGEARSWRSIWKRAAREKTTAWLR